MNGCHCGGDKTGTFSVLYVSNGTLYSGVARCYCGNAYQTVGEIDAPKNPALLTIEKWARRSGYHFISVGKDETYYEAFFREQNAWWHQNRERITKRAAKSERKVDPRPKKEDLLDFLKSQKQLGMIPDNDIPDFVKEVEDEKRESNK